MLNAKSEKLKKQVKGQRLKVKGELDIIIITGEFLPPFLKRGVGGISANLRAGRIIAV